MERLPRYAQRFMETLTHEVGLVVVLRGHLYVEAVIDKMLLAQSPQLHPKLKRRGFRRKLEMAKERGLVSSERALAVEALTEIRNEFAHDLDRDELTEADDQRMRDALSDRLVAKAHDCISGDLDEGVGIWARAGIAAIYNDLLHAFIELLVEKRRSKNCLSPTTGN